MLHGTGNSVALFATSPAGIRMISARALATFITVCILLIFTELAEAQPTLSGRVLNAQTGFGIVGIDLDVFDAQGHPFTILGDVTGAEGRFTLNLLGAGTYLIRADPTLNDFFVDQYYSNSFLRAGATLITVGPPDTVSNINFSLQSGFQIQGFVRSQGAPIADVDLDLYAANGEFLSGYPARSAPDGSFVLGVVPPGNYFLRAQPEIALGQFFVPAFYGGALELAHATPIVITSSHVSGLVLELTPGGAISGGVLDRASSSPLVGFDLDLYDTNGVRQPFNSLTGMDGNYVMGPVPSGRYHLRVDPTVQQGYARTYFSNAFFQSAAQMIEVQAGLITASIDFVLDGAGMGTGRILDAGTAQPISGVDLDVYDLATKRFDVTAKSDTNGYYLLGPLPTGSYFIRAQPGLTRGYLLQYYDRTTNLAGAVPVGITAGTTTSNINFQLSPAGWIEGVVSNTSGLLLAGIDLDIFEATTGDHLTRSALTKSNGTYQIGPVPPGQYKLRCDPALGQGYAVEYFDGKLTKALADVIVVAGGTGTSNVNFTLDPGGSLSGRVLTADSGQPVAAVDIDVFQAGTLLWLDQGAKTGADGRFALGPLPAGTYVLRADPLPTDNYVRTYYASTPDSAAAQTIILNAPGAVTNLDIQLIVKPPPPPLLVVSRPAPGTLRILLTPAPRRIYQLETRQSLTEGVWTPVGSPVTSSTSTVSWDLPLDNPLRFYRVHAR